MPLPPHSAMPADASPLPSKTLTEAQRIRFASHLLLPEIGMTGQARLCAASVRWTDEADEDALETARTYLERSGVDCRGADGGYAEVSGSGQRRADPVGAEGNYAADVDLGPSHRTVAFPSPKDIARLAGEPHLRQAAAALAGAFGAVETIKLLLGVGASGSLPPELSLTDPEAP